MASTPGKDVRASSSSPSPSLSRSLLRSQQHHSDSSPTPLPPWYFPGPSSRFNTKHQRTRSQFQLPRGYSSVGPVLNTAQRAAHRRAQSIADVPVTRDSIPSSPVLSRAKHQAPTFARSDSSTSSTYTVSTRTSISSMAQSSISSYGGPVTPSHHSNYSRPTSKLQDSPFSDYFTDDGRSPATNGALSAETQNLLLRLSKLQSQLMRGERESEGETNAIIGRKIMEMEIQMNSVHVQTRLPPDMEDSGLFMDEEDETEENVKETKDQTPDANVVAPLQSSDDVFRDELTAENRRAEHDFLIVEVQRVLENVRSLEENLRQKHAELRELNERHNASSAQVEDRLEGLESEREKLHNEIATLSTENAALKQDLAFDQTELLWLQMQFKAFQVEVQVSDEGAERMEGYAPALRDEIRQVKRERWAREMKRWEVDWEDVRRKMKERRQKYDVFADEEELPRIHESEEGTGEEDEKPSGWNLAMVKKGKGKVQQIIVTRVSADTGKPYIEDKDEATETETYDHDQAQLSVTENMRVAEVVPVEAEVEAVAEEKLSLAIDLPSLEIAPAQIEHNPPTKPEPHTDYTDDSTQTDDSSISIDKDNSWLFVDEYQAEHPISQAAVGDCAITTSSEADEDDNTPAAAAAPVRAVVGATSAAKTAWQELWTGLTNLAGLGEEDDYD